MLLAPDARASGLRAALRRWRGRRNLRAAFEARAAPDGRTLPIRRTGRGVWTPTPLAVVEEAAGILAAAGLLGEAAAGGGSAGRVVDRAGAGGAADGAVIDAGSGDGRVAAVLAWLHPRQVVCGVEADAALCARAAEHVRALAAAGVLDAAKLRLAAGDYCDPRTYAAPAIALPRTRLVLNYPDGRPERLARFVAAHCGRETTLALLTHDRDLTVDALPLRARHDVRAGGGARWRLSLYRSAG